MDKIPPIIGREYYDERYFNQYSEYFDISKSKFQQYRVKNVMKIYTPFPLETVIDMGMGWGTFTFHTAQVCKAVVGIDYSFTSLLLCNQRLREWPQKNIHLACADVQAVPLQSGSFDAIISADLIEHLYPAQFEGFLNECARLLKKQGKLVLWTPHDGHWAEWMKKNRIFLGPHESHVDYKSMSKIQDALLNHGFNVLKAYYVESHLPVIQVIEKALLKYCSWFRRRIAVLGEKV
jgi:cyclopropane fatty-acyl-phospholipid synthase-like methyltransferase